MTTTIGHGVRTAADRSLVEEALHGGRIEVAADGVDGLAPTPASAAHAPLTADVLVTVLSGGLPDVPAPRMITLRVLEVRGHLDLEAIEFDGLVIFDRCTFVEPVTLDCAKLGTIVFLWCEMPLLFAKEIATRGDFVLEGLRAGGVNLYGAEVGGDLVVAGAVIGEYGVVLRGAHVARDATFAAAAIDGALDGERARIDGLLSCTNINATGPLKLQLATIGGGLKLSGGSLAAGLSASRASIGDDLNCRESDLNCGEVGQPFFAGGDVDLRGAKVAGNAVFSGSTVHGCFLGEGLETSGSLFLDQSETRRAEVTGDVNLQHARIGGALQLSGSRLDAALIASDISVGTHAFFDMRRHSQWPFTSAGLIELQGARLGNAFFQDADLHGVKPVDGVETTLDMRGARVAGSLELLWSKPPAGAVVLAGAQTSKLCDDPSTWPPALDLRGFTYDTLECPELGGRTATACTSPRVRRKWIALAENTSHFSPQPYAQLVTFYRREGRDSDAHAIAYAAEHARRKQQRGQIRATWNAFLRVTVGYGYRPLQTLSILAVLLVAGTVLFSHLHAAGDITPTDSGGPRFVAAVYTLDRLIPVIGFGLRDAFALTGAAQWLAYAYTLAGWLLTIAVLAGLNAAVRRS